MGEHGKLHRLDGPALERADGIREWWVAGVELTATEGAALVALAPDAGEVAATLIAEGASPADAAAAAPRLLR